METRFKRACQDTEGFKGWKKDSLVGLVAGGLCWILLPEQEAMSEITAIVIAIIGGTLIVPLLEFIWNYYRAPIRILSERNVELERLVAKYESNSIQDVIDINGEPASGTWYGNKFVLDEPYYLIDDRYDGERFSIQFQVPCSIHSLVTLRYIIEHCYQDDSKAHMIGNKARLDINRPGNTRRPNLIDFGDINIALGNNNTLEASVENDTGVDIILTIQLLAWEQHVSR